MTPDWMDASAGAELITQIAGAQSGTRFADFGPIHLVTTGALAGPAEHVGTDVAVDRFRPNLVIDAPNDPPPGTQLRVGNVRLLVSVPTPRCVVPGLEHHGVPTDPAVLRTLGRRYRTDVLGRGRAACFGVYADVLEPGVIELADRLSR